MKILNINKELKNRLQDEDMANLIGASNEPKSIIIKQPDEVMLMTEEQKELASCCKKSCR